MGVRYGMAGLAAGALLAACGGPQEPAASAAPDPATEAAATNYFDNTGRDDVLSGGARLIEIDTPDGPHKVWTKRVGANPDLKLLLLHGGPGSSSELFEAMDSWLPGAGIEYYYYDQLGSYRSDKPENDALWTIPRFVDEVEQVRQALGLDETNFCVLGVSWGGILALEYALEHQEHLKCLVISNMMASIPAYNAYADTVIASRFDPEALEEIRAFEAAGDFQNERYLDLLLREHYQRHVLRMPYEDWPDPAVRGLEHTNQHIYVLMQGPSEFGLRGTLEDWDRTGDLGRVEVPTLTIGGTWDTMDPEHMEWMAGEVQNGRYLHTEGSHLALYDDQETYMTGLIDFLKSVENSDN